MFSKKNAFLFFYQISLFHIGISNLTYFRIYHTIIFVNVFCAFHFVKQKLLSHDVVVTLNYMISFGTETRLQKTAMH